MIKFFETKNYECISSVSAHKDTVTDIKYIYILIIKYLIFYFIIINRF